MKGLLVVVLAAGLLGSGVPADTEKMVTTLRDAEYDLVLLGGTILDGTGTPGYTADVAITGDRIAAIGDLSTAQATQTVDVSGQIVSPGFIDLAMGAYLGDPVSVATNENMIQMGVTTGMLSWEGGPVNMKQQQADIERLGTATNIIMFFPILSAWSQVVGQEKIEPTADQVDQMKALARQALEDGAFGVGAAIEYCPLCNAQTEPIIEIAKVAADHNAFYASHLRNEANDVINATAELIRIAEEAGVPGHVGHMKVAGSPNCGNAQTTTNLVWDALDRGLDISANQYPYSAGQTTDIGYLIPDWAEEGTELDIQLRLRDPATRATIVEDVETRIAEVTGTADRVEFRPHGTTLQQEADLRGASPGEAVLQIRENEQTRLTIIHFGCDEDLETILVQPWNSVATDMGPWVPIHGLTVWHPRGYGTFARILGEYVREEQLLTLEDAVRKMTGQPAYRTGLAYAQRGLLQEGWYADLVVFDPDTVVDTATYSNPGSFAEGINWVLINGIVVKRDGDLVPLHERLLAKPGRVLLHTPEMPSTPQPGYDYRPAAVEPTPSSQKGAPALGILALLAGMALVGAALRRRR